MITRKLLDEFSKTSVLKLDRNGLTDIQEVKIDSSLPVGQRLADYIQQVKNPYAYRCGSVTVLLQFNPDGKDLSQVLTGYFQAQKNHM